LNAKINLYGDLQYRTIDYSIKGDHDDLRVLTQKHNLISLIQSLEFSINYRQIKKFIFHLEFQTANRIEAIIVMPIQGIYQKAKN